MKPKRKTEAKSPTANPEEGKLRLTPANRRDAAAWLAMRQDLYSDVDDESHALEMDLILSSSDRACLLVRAPDDAAVGFIEITLRNAVDGCLGGPVGYIEGIYLIPSWRGLGLGPAMVDAVAEWFRAQGCRAMATDAEIDNEEAQQFWDDLGFEETYRIVQYRKSLGAVPAAEPSPPKKRASAKGARKKAAAKPRRR
ncbi:MAG TPA: GNAT family N-acetyltransferase [Candidatus Krumholzibacteria bacterium]|nr:GNAT family N-acetyltransferase [Candidatus Krumholzibacteria bacterium]